VSPAELQSIPSTPPNSEYRSCPRRSSNVNQAPRLTGAGGRFLLQVRAGLAPDSKGLTRSRSVSRSCFTGAASGIGLEACKLLHKEGGNKRVGEEPNLRAKLQIVAGWLVVAFDINLEDAGPDALSGRRRPGLKSLQKELGGPSECYIAQVDVGDRDQVEKAITDVEAQLPALNKGKKAMVDMIWANAGYFVAGKWDEQPYELHMSE